MKGGIDTALVDRMAGQDCQAGGQHLSQRHSTGGYAEEHQGAAIGHAFQHLGGTPVKGAAQIQGREQFEPMHSGIRQIG